jgi:hypothetical protein
VEYRRIQNDVYAGGWLRADIPAGASITAYAGTVERVSGNTKGFWLQGPDSGDFTATLIGPVTVDVSGYDTKFSWCAYASDCPPQALPTTSGYTLRGESDFIIQTASSAGSTVTHNTATYTDCIYGISDKTGAPGDPPPPVPAISDFTASASSICAGQSVTLTATATNAQRYSFNNGVNWVTSPTTVVSPTVTTTYVLKASRTAGGCTVTYPVQQTITVHPTPDVAFVSPPTGICANSSAILTATDLNSVAGSYCFTYECNECARNPYLTGNNDPAAVGCHWFSECIYSTANTYTVSMYDAGTMTVWAKAITEHGCVDSVSRVFTAGSGVPGTDCTVWTCGTMTWSTPLRNPAGCAGTTTLPATVPSPSLYVDHSPDAGYYYNWNCVSDYASVLCPSPWRAPAPADYEALIQCAGGKNANNLGPAWGYPGIFNISALQGQGANGYYWSTASNNASAGVAMFVQPGFQDVRNQPEWYGTQLRCVLDTP